MKPVICVVKKVYVKAESIFDSDPDFDVEVVDRAEAALAAGIREHKGFAAVVGTDKYLDELYGALPRGGIIARFGVGHDGVDKKKASAAGIVVTNTPGVLDDSVSELAVGFMAGLSRQLHSHDARVKEGKWERPMGRELNGKVLLVLGCGKIGAKVARIAAFGFGMKVIGFDAVEMDGEQMKRDWGFEKIYSSIDEAIGEADFVSVHLSANEGTKNFVNRELLSKMKGSACVINTARGSIVDESALYDAISSGQIAGAGLDVFVKEPYEPADAGKDLRKLEQVLMTPHVGSGTVEASRRMAHMVLENIKWCHEKKYGALNIVNADVVRALG